MADPLSSAASIIAVAACAAESSKFLFIFFRDLRVVSDNVHQSRTALESLHMTLTSLQQCTTRLDPNWQFSPHFRQRLGDCLDQLSLWTDKVSKIDNDLHKTRAGHQKWERKTKRCWQKIKWLSVGGHEMRRFLENIRLYQAEFSLELLTLLMCPFPPWLHAD